MFRLLVTIFLIGAGTFIYSYFRELNPGTVAIRTSATSIYELNTVSLVLLAMAVGAIVVAITVSAHPSSHVFLNWRSNRVVRTRSCRNASRRQ